MGGMVGESLRNIRGLVGCVYIGYIDKLRANKHKRKLAYQLIHKYRSCCMCLRVMHGIYISPV